MKLNKFLTTGLDEGDTVIVNAIAFRELLYEKEQLLRDNDLLKMDKKNRIEIYDAVEKENVELKTSLKETSDKLANEITNHSLTRAKLNRAILDKDTAVRKHNELIDKNSLMAGLLKSAKIKKQIEAYGGGRAPIKIDLKV